MATTSPILGMVIPAMEDYANIQPISTDLETLDTFAGQVANNSADAFDEGETYAVGDLCIYNNTLYKCTTAITTPGTWDATKWTVTNLGTEIVSRDTALSDQIANLSTTTKGLVTVNTTYIPNNALWYAKTGKVIVLSGIIHIRTTDNVPANTAVMTLPYAPYADVKIPLLRVGSTRVLTCSAGSTSATVDTYALEADAYYNINAVYLCS